MTTIISTLCDLLTTIRNSYTAVMNGFLSSAEVTQFAENSIVYKAMLFLNDSGDFVPVVTFHSRSRLLRLSLVLHQAGRGVDSH